MTEYTQIAPERRDGCLDAVQREFAKFERLEIAFRKKDREERVAELHLPIEDDGSH
jgi:hypothetical protein